MHCQKRRRSGDHECQHQLGLSLRYPRGPGARDAEERGVSRSHEGVRLWHTSVLLPAAERRKRCIRRHMFLSCTVRKIVGNVDVRRPAQQRGAGGGTGSFAIPRLDGIPVSSGPSNHDSGHTVRGLGVPTAGLVPPTSVPSPAVLVVPEVADGNGIRRSGRRAPGRRAVSFLALGTANTKGESTPEGGGSVGRLTLTRKTHFPPKLVVGL